MAVVLIPKPSKKSYDPGRDANALLLSQVEHLQHSRKPSASALSIPDLHPCHSHRRRSRELHPRSH